MTRPRTRFLAALATFSGFLISGFDAHVVPQAAGLWHGVTGMPSVPGITGSAGAALLVWILGGVIDTRPFLAMAAGLLPLIPAGLGVGSGFLLFSRFTLVLLFFVLLGVTTRDLIRRLPLPSPGAAFFLSLAFFLIAGRYVPGAAGPQGDEPHYLLIAESLIADGDLDLKNQFDLRSFSKFTSAALEPHTAPRSPKGTLYAIHTPGLSALIAPGYALFGYTGARAVLSLVMAFSVALLCVASTSLFRETTGFVFLLATFASPLPVYANAVFPDSAAAFPVAATLAFAASLRPVLFPVACAAIALLPWLHPRFLPLGLILALGLACAGTFSWRRAFGALIPLGISTALLLAHFQAVFGSASLSAAYGPGFSSDVSAARVPWGALALLLDRQFGLLLFAPALLLGLLGARALWASNRVAAGLAVGAASISLAVGGAFAMWWGGASPPARFLIAAVPALVLLCGASWHDLERQPSRRAVLGGAAGFSAGVLALACLAPRALHNRLDGDSGLLRLLAPTLDVDRFFPGFLDNSVNAKPFIDPFAASLRALESWDDHRRTFGGEDRRSAFVLDVPLGEPWILKPDVQALSPRFSLPRGDWTLFVESRTDQEPGVLNAARISLVGDDLQEAPIASLMLKAGETAARGDFDLAVDARRLRVRGEGLQSRTRVTKVRLKPR